MPITPLRRMCGTYVMNAHDLCMIEHLDELAQAGVSSFKIEGRNKRAFYVATAGACLSGGHGWRQPVHGHVRSACHFASPPMAPVYFGQPSQRQERDGYDKGLLMPPRHRMRPGREGGWRIEATCHNRFREGDELGGAFSAQGH